MAAWHIKTLENASSWEKDPERVLKILSYVESFFRRGAAWQVSDWLAEVKGLSKRS